MMKYILLLTFVFYIFLLMYPKFKVKINGEKSNNLFYRLVAAFALSLIFFLVIGLPLFGIICLFT